MPELAPVTMAILPLSDWTIRGSLLVDHYGRQSKSKAFGVRGSEFGVRRCASRRGLAGTAFAVQHSHLFCRSTEDSVESSPLETGIVRAVIAFGKIRYLCLRAQQTARHHPIR